MSTKIKLVQGDTKPQIKCVITDEATGIVQNIAGATALLKFRAAGSQTIITTLTGVLLPGLELNDGSISIEGPYLTAGTGGRVIFLPTLMMTNNPAGNYEGELEVTFADASVQTVYALLKFSLREQFR